MKRIIVILLLAIIATSCKDGTFESLSDAEVLQLIFEEANSSTVAYENLRYLTENFPKRLACYPQGIDAARWGKELMEKMLLDKAFLQEIEVMNWKRGIQELGAIKSNGLVTNVNVCALGREIGTGETGIEAQVIEVQGMEDMQKLRKDQVKGKIVFFNEPMDPLLDNPFRAYSKVAGQRFTGPIVAAEYGAVGAVIRSLTTSIDEFPHTGTTRKADKSETVPSICIATKHANLLSKMLKTDPDLSFYFKTNCRNLPDTISYNAVGEISGKEFPNEYIVVGGHLDSWDNSPGAHDDGGGCMQAIEVLRIFQKIGYKPKRSIRAVLFMDEEISQGGGRAYLEQAKLNNEKHILAIESDGGVTSPRGFTIDAPLATINKIAGYKNLFSSYNITVFEKGYGGVDINPLKSLGTPLMGLNTDPTHYFEWHHSANDTFDQVNREEMQKGAATMAAMVYLVDKYGL